MKRREFIKAGMIGGGIGVTGLWTTSCTTPASRSPERKTAADTPPDPVSVRYDMNSTEGKKQLETYIKAVVYMKQQPATVVVNNQKVPNGLSWSQQAAVHLNHCPHFKWNFLPWHRDYIKRFENIVRHISNDDTFTLPYWDWTANPN